MSSMIFPFLSISEFSERPRVTSEELISLKTSSDSGISSSDPNDLERQDREYPRKSELQDSLANS